MTVPDLCGAGSATRVTIPSEVSFVIPILSEAAVAKTEKRLATTAFFSSYQFIPAVQGVQFTIPVTG